MGMDPLSPLLWGFVSDPIYVGLSMSIEGLVYGLVASSPYSSVSASSTATPAAGVCWILVGVVVGVRGGGRGRGGRGRRGIGRGCSEVVCKGREGVVDCGCASSLV